MKPFLSTSEKGSFPAITAMASRAILGGNPAEFSKKGSWPVYLGFYGRPKQPCEPRIRHERDDLESRIETATHQVEERLRLGRMSHSPYRPFPHQADPSSRLIGQVDFEMTGNQGQNLEERLDSIRNLSRRSLSWAGLSRTSSAFPIRLSHEPPSSKWRWTCFANVARSSSESMT